MDLQAAANEGRAPGDPLPRSEAHVRYAAIEQRGAPEDRARTPRSCHHCHDSGHLLPLLALDGGSGFGSDGGCSGITTRRLSLRVFLQC
jgi:hypothetical protein